jgi:hypothetical protein
MGLSHVRLGTVYYGDLFSSLDESIMAHFHDHTDISPFLRGKTSKETSDIKQVVCGINIFERWKWI